MSKKSIGLPPVEPQSNRREVADCIILARALSVVNIHLMRAFAALRCRSQTSISDLSCCWVAMRRSRHWLRSTPISISTMLSQLGVLGDKMELQPAQHATRFTSGKGLVERGGRVRR